MKNYEISYLISSKLNDEEAEATLKKIESLFEQKQVSFLKNKIEKKILLGQEIKKEGQAFLASGEFKTTPEKILHHSTHLLCRRPLSGQEVPRGRR